MARTRRDVAGCGRDDFLKAQARPAVDRSREPSHEAAEDPVRGRSRHRPMHSVDVIVFWRACVESRSASGSTAERHMESERTSRADAVVARLVHQGCCEDSTRSGPGGPRSGAAVENRDAARRSARRPRTTTSSTRPSSGQAERPAPRAHGQRATPRGAPRARSLEPEVRRALNTSPATGSTSSGAADAGSTPGPHHRTCWPRSCVSGAS